MAADANTTGTHAKVYVERVEMRNFKGIEELAVDLGPGLTLLVGRNNAGKSRVLRALNLAVGGVRAERDDLTVGQSVHAEIDVVIAPRPRDNPAPDEQLFDDPLLELLGPALAFISTNPARQRYAWRTTITWVGEDSGARADSKVLRIGEANGGWEATSATLPRAVRDLLHAELVDTNRDLDSELRQRGTAIRRMLNDLNVEDTDRTVLEQDLESLGEKILLHSATLSTLRDSLNSLDCYVDAVGDARVDPVPRTLEELARTVGVSFGAVEDPLASRLHGSGVRSLASLLTQDVFYSRSLGIDGGDLRPHPMTLIEEPESHLHPHAILEVANLLSADHRQVVATTHSPLLAASVAPESLRLVRVDGTGRHYVRDFGPDEASGSETLRTRRPESFVSEMEKLTRSVERPFGELLFARAVVLGDGATERAFLPAVLRDALGPLAHGTSVVDSAGMSRDLVLAVIKFARHVDIPLVVLADADEAGRRVVRSLVDDGTLKESEIVRSGSPEPNGASPERGGAIEQMMIDFDPEVCMAACATLNREAKSKDELSGTMKKLKGSIGGVLAAEFVDRHPHDLEGRNWPEPLRELVEWLREALSSVAGEDEVQA